MHFHAEHALFFERRQPLWVASSAMALTFGVLITNAAARSTTLSMISAGVGAILLLFARARGHRRIEPALAWTVAVVGLALLGRIALDFNTDVILETSIRVLCGVVWVLWLGTQVDWASLRQLLLRIRVPEDVVASLDHALMHGVLTQREWIQRRDAARLRLGSPHLPLATWAPLLGEGALHAFARLEQAEENALLRSASSQVVEAHDDAVGLDAVDVDRGGQRVLEQLRLQLGKNASGCSYAGRAVLGNRACCASLRGSTGRRKEP